MQRQKLNWVIVTPTSNHDQITYLINTEYIAIFYFCSWIFCCNVFLTFLFFHTTVTVN